ncbi:hypothetical protein [Candidatus Uabimicrobium amorphum]|uniref:Uncharacterized protein n=1 Tax=Uabimicrobium amorphum TaxID=2596890 RepID=A0A5S9IIG8_UABAM|nr:hypothetical protein [Candidatus Uabimicrobium amorphum]BBM82187.1 hypothetical protein UABAM_00530 [Candidatus Uabimicrobium amorphum]
MTKKSSDYEITTLGQFIAVVVVLGIIYIISLIFPKTAEEKQNSNSAATTKTQNDIARNSTNVKSLQNVSVQKNSKRKNNNTATKVSKNNTKRKSTPKVNTKPKNAPKPNPKVVGYKEPRQKSAYVRKHHDIDVVKSTNYSKMAPLKNPRSKSEKWVMDRIKKYPKDLPRILLQDYGDDGYYINTLGKDALGRHIIPGINPDGQWSTMLYSNINRKGKRIKMILGHNWGKWKDQGFYVHAIYVSNKTISLRNKAGRNLASSLYPVNQSLSKGPVFRFR